jgi:UDP-glucose 4-epimerase
MTGRALITGGAGFIGSHVADRFLQEGWAVEIIDDLSSGKRDNVPAGAELHVLDIRSADAASIVAEGDWSVIVHLAAQMDVRRSVADPRLDASINLSGTLNLIEALRRTRHATATRFVFASTGGALYGDLATPPNAESTAKEPDSPYGIDKLAAEQFLAYYARVHGMDTATLRFANVYGPRQDPHGEAGVVAIFCRRILEGRPLTVFGDGAQTRDYVHVSDVVDATFRVCTAQLPAAGGVDARAFNVGTGVATTVVALANTLRSAVATDVSIEFAPKRAGEQQHSFLSTTKARAALGWSPRVALRDGLADTFAWFSSRAESSLISRP